MNILKNDDDDDDHHHQLHGTPVGTVLWMGNPANQLIDSLFTCLFHSLRRVLYIPGGLIAGFLSHQQHHMFRAIQLSRFDVRRCSQYLF